MIAAYLRVSTESQAERGTIEAQREFAEKYADLHGISLSYYADDGFTGTIPLSERPVGRQLMADIKSGKINEVFVYKIDRLGRNTRVILNSVYELEQAGAVIKSMTEPFDTSTPTGRFVLSIMAANAALDRDNTVERLWHGANRVAREDNRWLGGIVPYGYKTIDKHLQIDEQESAVVLMMYEWVASGKSCTKLADWLNAMNIPTAYTNGRAKRKVGVTGIWTPGRVRNLLVSTIYYGHHEYGKRSDKKRETVHRKMPAIVSQELWQKCQDGIVGNRIIDPANRKHDYLLRGLIKCAACGLNYTGMYFKGKTNRFYRCNGKAKYRGPIPGTCPSPNVSADYIENLVWDGIKAMAKNPGEELEKMRGTVKSDAEKEQQLEKEKRALLSAIENKAHEREIVIDMARKRIITQEEATDQLAKLASEKTLLKEQAVLLELKIKEVNTSSDDFVSIEKMLTQLNDGIDNLTFEEKRAVVNQLVPRIRVSDVGGKTKIDVDIKLIAHSHTDNHANKCYMFSNSAMIDQRYSSSRVRNVPSII